MRVIIALGGNALIKKGEEGTENEQRKNVEEAISKILPVINGNEVVITHGNGPQVGALLLQQKKSKIKMSLPVLNAMTQGQIGHWIISALNKKGKKAVAVITHVLIDKNDPRSSKRTKPIGPVYRRKVSKDLMYETGKGWRKFVPSPIPLDIVEKDEIIFLLERGFLVVACGGGGIPVVRKNNGMVAVEGVIDKDRASAVLAKKINANMLVMVTDVPYAYVNFGKPNQNPITKITWKEAESLLKRGEFGEGNMAPKIESAIDFSSSKIGRKSVICSFENFNEAFNGKGGSIVV
ncbi:MAG: carbamate kinase [Candidatus Anstonellales archaeon]